MEASQRFDSEYELSVVQGEISVEAPAACNEYIEGEVVAEDKAMELVMANDSLFLQRLAGTGKHGQGWHFDLHGRYMGELALEEQAAFSHRWLAIQALVEDLATGRL